jgi:hypothetical protein
MKPDVLGLKIMLRNPEPGEPHEAVHAVPVEGRPRRVRLDNLPYATPYRYKDLVDLDTGEVLDRPYPGAAMVWLLEGTTRDDAWLQAFRAVVVGVHAAQFELINDIQLVVNYPAGCAVVDDLRRHPDVASVHVLPAVEPESAGKPTYTSLDHAVDTAAALVCAAVQERGAASWLSSALATRLRVRQRQRAAADPLPEAVAEQADELGHQFFEAFGPPTVDIASGALGAGPVLERLDALPVDTLRAFSERVIFAYVAPMVRVADDDLGIALSQFMRAFVAYTDRRHAEPEAGPDVGDVARYVVPTVGEA